MSENNKSIELDEIEEDFVDEIILPVIPLRNLIMLPNMVLPVLVGRNASIEAVEEAMMDEKQIFCVPQKTNILSEEDPKAKELYRIGTICEILQMYKLPDGNIRILLSGSSRAKVKRFNRNDKFLVADVAELAKKSGKSSLEMEANIRTLKKKMIEYINLQKGLPDETIVALNEMTIATEIYYFILANISIKIKLKQRHYENDNLEKSIEKLVDLIAKEIEILQLEDQIESKVKNRLNKLQKEYYLNEQLKIIHKELGLAQEEKGDIIEFKDRIENTNLSIEAKKKADEELKKLSRLSTHSQEYGVTHSYLTWLLDLPWDDAKNLDIDLMKSSNILDSDHYGLKKIKERILEYLAVIKLTKKVRGQILCLVGPPGVGKTSLGKSLAKATGREFVRLSLGGVRDEAEIRGHRRTYVGSMPGIIMQSIKKAEVKNPLIMMDEVDKMSMDFRGDPSAALLEVLDPEQNNSFRDHYLDVEYDLSDVLFVTTANTLSTIPEPLIDRMEIIELPGYTEVEKKEIAVRHLVPRVLKDHEVEGHVKINFKEDTINKIIRSYTREAGVRELDRKIATIVRKIIKEHLEGKIKRSTTIKPSQLETYLGIEKHLYSEVNKKSKVGVITGLAWTMSGGDTLQIEVMNLPGEGKMKLTGQLGEVMQESAQAAYSLARKYAEKFNYSPDFYKDQDLHLHIPEGAIPKDGPSAGITMTTALISALSCKKIPHNLAMTGEVTLTGQVLAIGGLPEKLIAAKRAGIANILIPKLNEPHLSEVADEIKEGLNITLVDHIEQVLDIVFNK